MTVTMTEKEIFPTEQLVGRGDEVGVLRNALSTTIAGRGSVLLFTGEPGIGKSTLARAAATLARASGVSVHWGFSWEAGGAPAYWPWTQLLRSLVAERGITARHTSGLAQILPEVSSHAADDSALQPEQARFRLLESVRHLLVTITADSPVMIVLEDLHAADSDSLNLLHYIARHAASMPLLIVGTYREIEARASKQTEALWRTARDATALQLQRLREPDIRLYLQQQGGEVPDDEAVKRLLQTTTGNPLFLTELVGLLSRGGPDAIASAPLPDNVQQVIRQQIALLPGATVEPLSAASVFGREFSIANLSGITGKPESDMLERLQPALDAEFIRRLPGGGYRFGHVLCRDVLYQDLGATRRAQLHLQCAEQLRSLIDAGDSDSWSSLAIHLGSAGPEHRLAAIGALRNAAARARDRLAFDEAAALLQRALVTFGEGPKYDPLERCRLLVDCARALLVTGEIQSGQEHCREAFSIARAVDDPVLMSEVALAWGSAIVVARIDRQLIAALEECLEKLPADNAATRSRVQARLAGALQPALDPSAPMKMARDAITLARTTGDDEVIYEVIRYAVAALMDFAPVTERIALNREFGMLAAKFRDVPQQFRSQLLGTIDASESGDREMMDSAIQACSKLADNIGLPHYQWRAASVRAMQAMIDGQFERVSALLDQAWKLAERAEDLQARVTLSIQQFALLVEWDSPAAMPLTEIEAQLRTAYEGGIGDAEFFVAPFIAVYKRGEDKQFAKQFVANEPLVERTFAGGDRYSVTGLGQMALNAGNRSLAERCYETLLDFSDGCATLGLMGSCWCGPIAYSLGTIAVGLDRLEEAREHFETAQQIATRMRAQPFIARIHASTAELARRVGDEARAHEHAEIADSIIRELALRPERKVPGGEPTVPRAARTADFFMRPDGEVWTVEYDGKSATIRDSKGLGMLAKLIEHPDAEIHVLDLAGITAPAGTGHAGPMLDSRARDDYRHRVEEIREELQDAESLNDMGRADALRSELDFISRELSRAYGLGGRQRAAGDAAERARVNVRRRIKDAVERIGEQIPDAGRYLENTIKTGRYCKYTPM